MREYPDLSAAPKKILPDDCTDSPEEIVEQEFIDPTCVKCGSEEATLEYKGNNVVAKKTLEKSMNIIEYKGNNVAAQKTLEGGMNIIKHGVPKVDEVLIVTCTRCGYQWTDTPLDCREVVKHTNLDDPNRHNISGDMNKPTDGATGYRSR